MATKNEEPYLDRVSEGVCEVLCPLGQPEKTIDHESLIEPWLALYNRPACEFQTPNGVVTTTG